MSDKPRQYDMTKKEDRLRWFREMKGYLRNFREQGTDFEGREFAYAAFLQLKQIEETEVQHGN